MTINDSQNESATYCNFVEFNQDDLQLKKEVVQFKITFHQDDVIDVSSKMAVLYVDETITSAYFLLTDGEKPLLEPSLSLVCSRKKVTYQNTKNTVVSW